MKKLDQPDASDVPAGAGWLEVGADTAVLAEPEPVADIDATPLAAKIGREHKAQLGQFLTSSSIGEFMASLFGSLPEEVHLLDAGAGTGALTCSFVRWACLARMPPRRIAASAYELDPVVIPELQKTLAACGRQCKQSGVEFASVIHHGDFLASVVPTIRGELFAPALPPFNAAIVNPPYRKIRSDTTTRSLLRSVGVETSNLYTAFVALVMRLLVPGSQLVTITPRSFCNGPYFRPFRESFLSAMSLRQLHVFESRSAAFRQEEVLQENVIMHAVKGAKPPERVIISTSSGDPGGAISKRVVAYREVVNPGDPEQFIHLPTNDRHELASTTIKRFAAGLSDLGLSVSTGRVVDFRARGSLRPQPDRETVPLIYPCHFAGGFVHWPKQDGRKPNAIVRNEATEDLLVPAGIYVLVKRFTSKEERRRIVACIYDPHQVSAEPVGFENHLNYFHVRGHGLTMNLAKGLAAFLNSSVTDTYFRQFSGHTQVNATDLRSFKYPATADLECLGSRLDDPGLPQAELDSLIEEELL